MLKREKKKRKINDDSGPNRQSDSFNLDRQDQISSESLEQSLFASRAWLFSWVAEPE